MLKLLLLSAVLIFDIVLAQSPQNPNPCAGVPGNDRFVNDWSSCATYFWCNNGNAVPTIPCNEGLGFDQEKQLCTPSAAVCPSCPPDMNIAVAYPTDLTCRSYVFCEGGRRSTYIQICPGGDRFDRVIGSCRPEAEVACWLSEGTPPPAPPTTLPPPTTPPPEQPPQETTLGPSIPQEVPTPTPSFNVCDPNLCPGRQHIACGHSGGFHSSCPSDSRIVPLSSANIQAILNNHNNYRNTIASGRVSGFQPAARMATMQWSNDLANFAELNVKQCQMSHDSCRNTPEFMFAGQNLGWRAAWGSFEPIESVINNVIQMWWDEVALASQPDIDRCCDAVSRIGHFTQLVADRAIQVGCAVATYSNEWRNSLMACNYAFTNLIGQRVYVSGPSASACTTGTNPSFPGLCSVNEPIRAIP